MNNQNIQLELALDCADSERILNLQLQGKSAKIMVLGYKNLPGPQKPLWMGACGSIEVKHCRLAVADLEKWVIEVGNASRTEKHLIFHPADCLYAWRRSDEENLHIQAKSGVSEVKIKIESRNDLNILLRTLREFILRMEGRFPTR